MTNIYKQIIIIIKKSYIFHLGTFMYSTSSVGFIGQKRYAIKDAYIMRTKHGKIWFKCFRDANLHHLVIILDNSNKDGIVIKITEKINNLKVSVSS